ncbi:MAG: hypothetical protein PHH60_01375 [Candidatus Margulisbacteria bacterium]|nr:hypothetical protein [Candidatus Margulisiibacteriota bacterium]
MVGKIIKVILGLAFVALGAWTIYLWWGDLLTLIRGCIGLFLILAGLITFALVAD